MPLFLYVYYGGLYNLIIMTKNKNTLESIKNQLDLASAFFSVIGIKTNIQIYFLTDYNGKKALTKNPSLRAQGDESLPSSPKRYDILDDVDPPQVVLAVIEKQTKYKHVENYEKNPKQAFVVTSPIISDDYGAIGSICFAGTTDPVLSSQISFEDFKVISEALAKSLASSLSLLSQEDLVEISK